MNLAEARLFSLKDSEKSSFDGDITKIKDNKVYIATTDSRVVTVPMSLFNAEDVSYVNKWAKGNGGDLKYASWVKYDEASFSKPWPGLVRGSLNPNVEVNEELTKGGVYVYETKHYQFVSDAELNVKTVQKFATLFEATYEYNCQIPLNNPGRHLKRGELYKILLYETYDGYVRGGGPAGSAGVYFSRNGVIAVPFASIGLQKGNKKWIYDSKKENTTLAHEITHQMMFGSIESAWYIEGSAEYVAATPYKNGLFRVRGNIKSSIADVTKRKKGRFKSGRGLGKTIDMAELETFMNYTYPEFQQNANNNYGCAHLLTYYFYHGDKRGRAENIKNYIKAIQKGVDEKEAQKELLAGRTYGEVQRAFQKYWEKQGISLQFF